MTSFLLFAVAMFSPDLDVRSPGSLEDLAIPNTVMIRNGVAYVTDAVQGLVLVDVTDPDQPKRISSRSVDATAQGIALQGSVAYIAGGVEGVVLVDVSNPAAPQVLGRCDTPDVAKKLAVAGEYAFVADLYRGLQVLDVSDTSNPRLITGIKTSGPANDIAYSNSFVFVAADQAGLEIFDVSNPASPRRVGLHDTSGSAWSVAVSDNDVYVADYNGGVQIIHVSDPTNPRAVGNFYAFGLALHVSVSGELAMISDYHRGIQVVDISEPANPRRVGSYYLSRPPLWTDFFAGRLFAISSDGLHSIDPAIRAVPQRDGHYNTGGSGEALVIANNHAFVADWLNGIEILDVSEPKNPRPVANYKTLSPATDITIAGDNKMLVATRLKGIELVDTSVLANPQRLGSYSTAKEVWGVAVAGNHAFLSMGRELQVIDLKDPTRLVPVASYENPDASFGGGMAIVENYLYTPTTLGLEIFDIGNLPTLRLVGKCETNITGTAVAVAGNLAVVTGNGIHLFDVTDTSSPKYINHLALDIFTGGSRGVIISGPRVYISAVSGVHVVDVSDPTRPRRLSGNTALTATDLVRRDDFLFVSGAEGLWVMELEPSLRIRARKSLPGEIELQTEGYGNSPVQIERSIDLITWEVLQTATDAKGLDFTTGEARRFYRAVQP